MDSLSRILVLRITVFKLCMIWIIAFHPIMHLSVIAQQPSIEQIEDGLKNTYGFEKLKALNRLTEYYLQENLRKAIKYGKQAVALGEDIFVESNTNVDQKERYRLVQAYFQLGKAYYEKEDYFDSLENFEAAKALANSFNYKKHLKETEFHIGKIHSKIESGDIKENFFSKNFGDIKVGEAFSDASKDIKIQSELMSARSNEKKGEFREAIDHYEKAINLLRDKGDAEKINELQLQIAFLLDSLDQHLEAQQYLSVVIEEIEASFDTISPVILSDSLTQLTQIEVKDVQKKVQETLREEQKNLKELSESFAKQKDYEKSLAYYKLYQELSQKMIADSLGMIAENMRKENEVTLLKQQKRIADLSVKALEEDKAKQVRLRNTAIVITLLILISALVTLFFYISKQREHKKLTIAYRDLDKTKNKLVGAEKKIVKLLNQQLSGDVVKQLLTGNTDKPGERLFVCIMFLDIRDFTPMVEKLSPEEIIAYQNNVFGFMIDIVQKHKGNLNQLLGDGFLAVFGAPESHGNDCQNAFDAAKEILSEIKERNEARVIPKTKIGIGLHAGYVVTGNVGNEARKQYSVTGNPVIIASRVEQLNKTYKSQLIITEEVYNKLEKPIQLTQPFLEVEVKGRTNPVKILKMA